MHMLLFQAAGSTPAQQRKPQGYYYQTQVSEVFLFYKLHLDMLEVEVQTLQGSECFVTCFVAPGPPTGDHIQGISYHQANTLNM